MKWSNYLLLLRVIAIAIISTLSYWSKTSVGLAQTSATACANPVFRAIMDFPTDTYGPYNLASGDYNGDDLPDLAVFSDNKNTVLLGDGSGKFGATGAITLPLILTQGVTGDFNNDGIPDLAGISFRSSSDNVGLMLGDGTGHFGQSALLSASNPFHSLAGDFNRDGNLDLLVCNSSTRTLDLYPGNGAGKFGAVRTTQLERGPTFMAAGDFNKDGVLDLAVAHLDGNSVSILANDGTGRFTPLNSFTTAEPFELAIADFNLDQRLDVAVLNNNPRQLVIFLSTSAGQFMRTADFAATNYSRIYTKDLNRDNAADLLLIKEGEIDLLLNNGNGSFGRSTLSGLPSFVPSLLTEDVNLDGQVDLIFSNTGDSGGKVYVCLREPGGGFVTVAQNSLGALTEVGISSVSGDFNRDGNPDVLVLHVPFTGRPETRIGAVSLLLGNSAGQLTELSAANVGLLPTSLLVRDFNGNGRDDWAVTVQGENQIAVALGTASGAFAINGRYDVARAPGAMVAGDFNGDGKIDLAANGPLDNVVTILLGDGTGKFPSSTRFPAGESPLQLAAGDFNQDGKLDLAVSSNSQNKITILPGDGAGRLGAGSSFDTIWRVATLSAADINQDGKLDLIATERHPSAFLGAVALWFGDGAGKFTAAGRYDLDGSPVNATLGDLNGDGRLDLAVSNEFLVGVTLFQNNGAGRFINKTSYYPYGGVSSAAINDFNKDGRPDLFLMTGFSRYAVIQGACAPTPTLASASAASYRTTFLAKESVAAAFGTALSTTSASANTLPLPTTLAGVSVSLKDSAGLEHSAPLFFVSPTQINFQVPAAAADGQAVITVKNNNAVATTGSLRVARVAPGLFAANASGQGLAAALAVRLRADGSQSFEAITRFDAAQNRFVAIPLDVSNPAEQVFMVLFGTGIRYRSALSKVTARVGGETAEVSFAGAQGQLVGLDQINLRLSRSLSGRGEVDVFVTADGKTSNVVKVNIK